MIYDASLDQISRPQSIDFQNIWDIYSTFSKPSLLHSGNQYSSLFTTDIWNKRDQQLSIIQEFYNEEKSCKHSLFQEHILM